MIRHRPSGSGHPYSDDTEQRSPVVPVAGEPLRLGVRTSPGVTRVDLEIDRDGQTRTVPLEPVARSSRGQAADGGHLASAAARDARRAGGWETRIPAPPAGAVIRYRFVGRREQGGVEHTRWFSCRSAQWRAAGEAAVNVDGGKVVGGSVEVLDDGERLHRVRFALPLAPGEHVTGFGERFDASDHRGSRLDSVVFEQYKSQGAHRRTYLPMPFAHVIGGAGWGFHVRTSRRVWFDIGATDDDLLVVEAEVDAPTGAEGVLDLALYSGRPQEVLEAFVSETGRPVELPDWVFRLWASGNEWNTQAEVERQMRLHREHDIPVGNVVIEAWSDESTFTAFRDAEYDVHDDARPHRLADFTFPETGAWPDPKGMVDALHHDDVRVHLWQIPLMKMRPHPSGQAAADARAAIAEDVLLREEAPDGSLRPYRNRGWWFPLALMPDLADDRAARWWTEKRRYLVEEIGIDGFKTDGGEHAWGRDVVALDGSRGDVANNRFPVAYAAAYGRLLESAGKAPVTFSRAGFTGSPAHGAFWAGDENSTWEAFRWSMFAGLSAASCGIVYWGWDIAGFSGPTPDAELYVRAMAASVFVPIMQYHSEFNHHRTPSNDRTPWNIAERTGDAEVLSQVRELVHLRERLVPYIAAAAREAVGSSRPLMRPLSFEHPDDPAVWEHPLQWYFGDDLLVAPVLEPGVTSVEVYLPAGAWVDVWTGEEVTGGAVGTVDVSVRGRIPVFARAAAWREGGLKEVFAG
ncbi:glycoside hydrolase family 31 protein [Microbacterium aquimaris]|uniref:Glycoside hydrolase family 31 protein n=1 Tax=Microbacterium aquimaris TaxID=459816 RepID=A0ABU5N569_9MICO|nr:TIM-barrel domain-containing protein [Microbacterium aquimaris]MDZ8161200.1 glycoside hydrolase family 31 protein [Microbacterium aquimaris]